MSTRFLHTADWQLGKPFAGVHDSHKRALLQQERINAIRRIGDAAAEHAVQFIVIAGDLFDSPTASRAVVSAACSAIGQLKVPVLAIPGNHDHGGPGCVWKQEFFQHEQDSLAPNLRVLLTPEPVDLDTAWIFPCPLLRRSEPSDTTAWLRQSEAVAACSPDKPRIVLAHGSTQDFSGQNADEEGDTAPGNLIDLTRLPAGLYDYVALGDWHGTKQVTPHAWYSGTPELDRFPKGEDHAQGNVLVVESQRGQAPNVTPICTARLGWHEHSFQFTEDAALELFKGRVGDLLGLRANEDLLHLRVTGALGVEASARLEQFLDALNARLLRLKLVNECIVAPSADEVAALTQRPGDPLISRVAAQLVARTQGTDEPAAIARVALRELFTACNPSH
jgi:DNA repair exonuclease SbcCD nuclease subunit